MDPLVVSAAQTIIEAERAKRTLDMYRAYTTVYAEKSAAQATIDTLLSRTSYLWLPTTPQERQQREATKVDAATLALINSALF